MSTNENKIKNLTPAELKKQVKKLDAQYEATVMVGDEPYKIRIDEVFKKSKQHKLLDDMVKFFNEMNNDATLVEFATPYTTLLIVKHFTNIEIPDEVEKALEYLSMLIDLELVDKILNAMPEDEVVKMYELLTDTINNVNKNLAFAVEEEARLRDKIDNNVVKDVLLDGKTE